MGENRVVAVKSGRDGAEAGLAFRISILNFTLYVAALFALIFGLMHDFGINEIGRIHSIVDYLYAGSSVVMILLLRRSRQWFRLVAPLFVLLSLLCFTSALVFVTNDEFRLIWFYFVIFVTYILLGERAGLAVTVASLLIVLLAMLTLELQLSSRALTSGLLGMVVISVLTHSYSKQIRHYEAQLEEQNRALQQSVAELDTALAAAWDANRAKTLFLANMSHEIRTPMNGVLGMVQVLQGTALDKAQEHYVESIDRAGKNLLVLIDDLLDISRIESGKLEIDPKPFSLFAWVMDLQFICEALFEESRVDFTTEIGDELPRWLLGDAARLTQIVTNLVSNAAKFTSEGEVRLAVHGAPQGREHCRLSIEVVDSGSGIPEEKLAHIFEPFEQVNPERIANKGVGLGLAISKHLADAMGGQLSVASGLGEGSRFHLELTLPVVNMVRREGSADSRQVGRKLHLLLVDDDAINRLTVRTLLTQQGHQVSEAENGEQALEALQVGRFDLVLMDVHMPVLDGVSATRKIRNAEEPALAAIPIIGLTASVMADEKRRYLAAGMSAVVQKPIVLEQLLATIHEHLAAREAGCDKVAG